jgi:CheY-like chemotaxis protein
MSAAPPLLGLRVFVVEDDFLLASTLSDLLSGWGCHVLGPTPRLEEARRRARREQIDLAILDVNIAGTPVYPLVDDFTKRKVPVVLSTGYPPNTFPPRYQSLPCVRKPYSPKVLQQAIRKLEEAGALKRPALDE